MLAENRSTPRSDEELQKLTVGELKPHNAPITIVEYDPSWPDLFEREANRIRSVLGTKALQIEHVGSTSVPGLCAKPIIDMLLVVTNSADEPSYVPVLESSGYTLRIREPEWFELYWSSFLVTLCSEIMLYIETPLVSYSYSLNEVSHSCTS